MFIIVLLSAFVTLSWSPTLEAASASSLENVIFRWVDEKGKIHYGSEAPKGVEVETIQMASHTPSTPSASADTASSTSKKSRNTKTQGKRSAGTSRKTTKKKRKAPSSTALERQRISRRSKCIEAKAKLRRIDNKFRSGFTGRQGERLRERQQVWTMIKNEFCSPP